MLSDKWGHYLVELALFQSDVWKPIHEASACSSPPTPVRSNPRPCSKVPSRSHYAPFVPIFSSFTRSLKPSKSVSRARWTPARLSLAPSLNGRPKAVSSGFGQCLQPGFGQHHHLPPPRHPLASQLALASDFHQPLPSKHPIVPFLFRSLISLFPPWLRLRLPPLQEALSPRPSFRPPSANFSWALPCRGLHQLAGPPPSISFLLVSNDSGPPSMSSLPRRISSFAKATRPPPSSRSPSLLSPQLPAYVVVLSAKPPDLALSATSFSVGHVTEDFSLG